MRDLPQFIGMVHLGALPGAPRFAGDLDAVVQAARRDAEALAAGGVDAIMIENFHDTPFFKDGLPPVTIAALTRCALAVRQAAPSVALGINALRNDGLAALGVARAVDARLIRINVLCGAMVTDQGIIEGCAAEVLRARAAWGGDVAILADVAVKHAAPLAALDLDQMARDTVYRGHADALVVSGTGTGAPCDPAHVQRVRAAVAGTPVYVGSGATPATVQTLGADGYIVGTALKRDGQVDRDAVRALKSALVLGSTRQT